MRNNWKLYALGLCLVFALAASVVALWPADVAAAPGLVCPSIVDGEAHGWATKATCEEAKQHCRWNAQSNADLACTNQGSLGVCSYGDITYSSCTSTSGGIMVDCDIEYTCWDYEP